MSAIFTIALMAMTLAPIVIAEDAYTAWMQGRPQESLPLLEAQARSHPTWDACLDCGLAAFQAGLKAQASAWFLAAHQRAPQRPEPLQALRIAENPLPPTRMERLGPVALPGASWQGIALLAGAGFFAGWGLCRQTHRRRYLLVAAIAGLIAAPGAVASWLDAHDDFVAVAHDTALVDTTGAALMELTAGAVVLRENMSLWNGRMRVRSLSGTRGYLAAQDMLSEPAKQ